MKLGRYLGFTLASLFITNAGFSCTDFRTTAKDGSVLITRSMEYGVDMKANLRTSSRGRAFSDTAPDGKPGLSWKAKYGYVYLDAFNVDAALDGMNEKGLSIESLYLPGYAEYQTVPAGQDSHALSYLNFADWVLGNFKTVEELQQALQTVYVYLEPFKLEGHGTVTFPLHFSIYDNSGKGIVVEYVGGKLTIYDHLGVVTNSPTYDWHMKNLYNYIALTPSSPAPVMWNGMHYAVYGNGFGMLGLPGDISPPSRFVKIATLMRVADSASNVKEALNLAEHVINNVDIPLGLARESDGNSELTQWVVFKDLTHRVFYYRTYRDMSLRSISLDQLDFSEKATRLKMPIERINTVNDLTIQFIKTADKRVKS